MDRVRVENLKVETVVGVHAWERRVRQTLVLSLEVATDVSAAAATDDIAAAVDYSELANRVDAFIRAGEFRLLETLADRTAAMILEEFDVSWVSLRVDKPGAVAAADSVGVEIERARAG